MRNIKSSTDWRRAMLKNIVDLVERLLDEGLLIPHGYKIYSETGPIKWIIEVTPDGRLASQPEPVKILSKPRPGRQRSGTPSPTNLKPYLLADDARYALGLPEDGKEEEAELLHGGFVSLLEDVYEKTKASYLSPILAYLKEFINREELAKIIEPKDVVTFSVGELPYPFERREMHKYWAQHIGSECSSKVDGQCSICGGRGRLLKTLPLEVVIMGQKCQISAFNWGAARSHGREKTVNAQICDQCGLTAAQALDHLLKDVRHCSVIARDDTKGDSLDPLRNQISVFWLERQTNLVAIDGMEIDLLDLVASPLEEEWETPETIVTLSLLQEAIARFWTGREAETLGWDDRFHLAVLSANKGRLVIRDWVSTPLGSLLNYLDRYLQALRIISPSGNEARAFSIPAIIAALEASSPNIVRGLIRTAYAGYMVPAGCLENAVYRMRVNAHKSDRNRNPWSEGGKLHILAAVIKLALTHGTEEAEKMERLNTERANQGYLCGRLLAILEEIQQRAARYRLNATLVERYIGSASTSPGTTFPQLLKLAESGHLPKIRKERMGYGRMREMMQDVCTGIDESGGFPSVLSLREQGEFMLGFYHQRAEFAQQRELARKQRQADSEN
jgi:CRISPR-associated protein Csd1